MTIDKKIELNKEYFIIEKNIEILEKALISLNKEILLLREKRILNFFEDDLKKLKEKEKEFNNLINELKKWNKLRKDKLREY